MTTTTGFTTEDLRQRADAIRVRLGLDPWTTFFLEALEKSTPKLRREHGDDLAAALVVRRTGRTTSRACAALAVMATGRRVAVMPEGAQRGEHFFSVIVELRGKLGLSVALLRRARRDDLNLLRAGISLADGALPMFDHDDDALPPGLVRSLSVYAGKT